MPKTSARLTLDNKMDIIEKEILRSCKLLKAELYSIAFVTDLFTTFYRAAYGQHFLILKILLPKFENEIKHTLELQKLKFELYKFQKL